MNKTLEDFTKKVKKLDDYFLLREEGEYIIVGTKIIIKEHKEFLGNVFQPRTQNIDKELLIYFVIITNQTDPKKIKEFKSKQTPMFTLTNKHLTLSLENLNIVLEEFVKTI